MAKNEQILVNVSKELKNKVKEQAKREGGNVATLVRRALINHINAAQK